MKSILTPLASYACLVHCLIFSGVAIFAPLFFYNSPKSDESLFWKQFDLLFLPALFIWSAFSLHKLFKYHSKGFLLGFLFYIAFVFTLISFSLPPLYGLFVHPAASATLAFLHFYKYRSFGLHSEKYVFEKKLMDIKMKN